MSADNDFDIPGQLVEPEYDAFATSGPAHNEPTETMERTARERTLSLMANKDRYKESEAQHSASLVYAALAQADAADRSTDALTRLSEATERQAVAAERLVVEQRINNQLMFFSMSESDFAPRPPVPAGDDYSDGASRPESLYSQMRRNIGITAAPRRAEAEAASAPNGETADF